MNNYKTRRKRKRLKKIDEDIINLILLNDVNIIKEDGKKVCDIPARISLDFEVYYSYSDSQVIL